MKVDSRRIIGIILTLLTFWFLWYVSELVVYFLVSIVITLVLRPLVSRLNKIEIKGRQFPHWLSSLVAMAAAGFILVSVIRIFTPLVASEVKVLSSINLEDQYNALSGPLGSVESFIEDNNIRFDESMDNKEYIKQSLVSLVDVSKVSGLFTNILSGLGNFVYILFVISFITFFLLKDSFILDNMIDAIIPDEQVPKVKRVMKSANKSLTRYFTGLIMQITLITTINSIGLSILGVKNALVIGLFTGLINVIPYIGPMIGTAFGLIIIVSTSLGMPGDALMLLGLKSLGVFMFTQAMDNFVFQPVIFGRSINAHPLEIFFVIMIGAQIGGIGWMIIAVPVYSFIRILAKEFLGEYKFIRTMTQNVE
jgi:predicted PurR-regulated permease PerM